MKFLTAILLLISGVAKAQLAAVSNKVISETMVTLNIDISTTKVKLSGAGYSSPVVKVLVPDLADVTLLDHRNVGEGAPCLATYETFEPSDIIKNNPAVEKADFKIRLSKIATVNATKNICEITLEESIRGEIRGFTFVHDRSKVIATRAIADCR